MNEKQMYYFLAVKEIVELFAQQEIGTQCEINILNTLAYVQSMKFVNDTWGLKAKDEIYQLVTDDILAGYPVWELLNLPDWKRQMLERELADNQVKERRHLEKIYKCYTCRYFKEQETSLGVYRECTRPKESHQDWMTRRGCFEPKKKCTHYSKIIYHTEEHQNDKFAQYR